MNQKTMVKFHDALEFLNNHPVFLGKFKECCYLFTSKVNIDNKENYSESIYPEVDGYDDWFNRFATVDDVRGEDAVEVPFIDYHGMKWQFHHVNVHLEVALPIPYIQDNIIDTMILGDNHTEVYAPSFEECIIMIAQTIETLYGKFTFDVLEPKWLRDNNDDCKPMIPCPDKPQYVRINPEYILFHPIDDYVYWLHTVGKNCKHLMELYESFNEREYKTFLDNDHTVSKEAFEQFKALKLVDKCW